MFPWLKTWFTGEPNVKPPCFTAQPTIRRWSAPPAPSARQHPGWADAGGSTSRSSVDPPGADVRRYGSARRILSVFGQQDDSSMYVQYMYIYIYMSTGVYIYIL